MDPLKDLEITSLIIFPLESRKNGSSHGNFYGLLHVMVIRQIYWTVLISAVIIVCGEVNMSEIGLTILVIKLDHLKYLEMISLTVHFKIWFLNVWMIGFVVGTTDEIKISNIEMTDLVSLIGISERYRNINIYS